MSVLADWLASPAPEAAVEIAPGFVSIATIGRRADAWASGAHAIEPLPPGAVAPTLTEPNLVDEQAVAAALRAALDRVSPRPRRVGLIVPDISARVSLVRFDRVPARRDDLDQLVRWQVKKAAPFPVDDACISYLPGASEPGGGGEFLVVLARRSVIREYEGVCERIGLHPGLVDLSTLSLLNLQLAGGGMPTGDWLVVHLRPEYTSVAILRGPDVMFFRTRLADDADSLADLVHQTTMYYQDRLGGHQFSRVLIGGEGRDPSELAEVRRNLDARLGIASSSIAVPSGVSRAETLAPVMGLLRRAATEAGVA